MNAPLFKSNAFSINRTATKNTKTRNRQIFFVDVVTAPTDKKLSKKTTSNVPPRELKNRLVTLPPSPDAPTTEKVGRFSSRSSRFSYFSKLKLIEQVRIYFLEMGGAVDAFNSAQPAPVSRLCQDSNPGRLVEKRGCYLCVMPIPKDDYTRHELPYLRSTTAKERCNYLTPGPLG